MDVSVKRLGTLLTVALLAGCSGLSQPATTGSTSAQSSLHSAFESVRAADRFGIDAGARSARMASRGAGYGPAKKSAQTLFVSDLSASAIRLYPANVKNPKQTGEITQGIDLPVNIAVDQSGTLYVANNGNSTVTEYPLGQTTPSVTLTNSLVYPNGIAVDSAGTVYVTSGSSVGDTYVLEFPKGATSPSVQVDGFGLAIGLAIDKAGNLYVGDAHTNEVFEVAKGTTKPVDLALTELADPTGVAISPKDDLYVSNESPSAFAVHGYKLGQTTPFVTITDGTDGPYAIGFSASGTLFVGNGYKQPGNVTAYKKNATAPYETIAGEIENPVGIGVYPGNGF